MDKHLTPIGIFDSGIGGTSIWKEIKKLLPNEDTIYLADSKNAPYGNKEKEEIIALAAKNTEFLLQNNCKLIVVACNTATTNAISYLRATYDVPFIGIEPAIKPASLQTKTKVVGLLATKGTLHSELFSKTSSTIDKDIVIKEKIGTGLVELIESGQLQSEELFSLLHSYIQPLLEENVDCLVLGCTHYPYLIPQIRKIVGEYFPIIDSGEAVAKQTKHILTQKNILSNSPSIGSHRFYTNGKKEVLEQFISESDSIQIKATPF